MSTDTFYYREKNSYKEASITAWKSFPSSQEGHPILIPDARFIFEWLSENEGTKSGWDLLKSLGEYYSAHPKQHADDAEEIKRLKIH